MSEELSRPTELLSIGQQCSAKHCLMVDFLPIKCNHCALPYCSDHFQPTVHSCTHFDPAKYDRVAPECPFCGKFVAFAAGVDPNLAMEKHFDEKCEVVRGGGLVGMKAKMNKSASEPRCARTRCNKILVTPIRCESCSQQFCPEHRFPGTHTCTQSSARSAPSVPKVSAAATKLTPRTNATSSTGSIGALAPKSLAGLAAAKRAAAAVPAKAISASKQPSPSKPVAVTSSSSSQSSPSIPNPFGKTERWDRSSLSPRSSIKISLPSPTAESTIAPLSNPTTAETMKSDTTAVHATTSSTESDIISKPIHIIPQSFAPPPLFAAA